MQRKEDRQSQQTIPVRDRVAEVGINLNTVFTALVLAGILWAGSTLNDIKSALGELNVTMAVVRAEYMSLRKDFDEHRKDQTAHGRWGK